MTTEAFRFSFGGDGNVVKLDWGGGRTVVVNILKTTEPYPLEEGILWEGILFSPKLLCKETPVLQTDFTPFVFLSLLFFQETVFSLCRVMYIFSPVGHFALLILIP